MQIDKFLPYLYFMLFFTVMENNFKRARLLSPPSSPESSEVLPIETTSSQDSPETDTSGSDLVAVFEPPTPEADTSGSDLVAVSNPPSPEAGTLDSDLVAVSAPPTPLSYPLGFSSTSSSPYLGRIDLTRVG